MGKIFGISNLPVSTIGETITPVKEFITKIKQPVRKVRLNTLEKTPKQDVFIKKEKTIRNNLPKKAPKQDVVSKEI